MSNESNPDDLYPDKDHRSIKSWQKRVYQVACDKGWWDGTDHNIPEKLALIHSEVSEALEDYRVGAMETCVVNDGGKVTGFPVELADAVIRILDLAEHLGIDLEEVMKAKHRYNETRPIRHGGKRC